MLFVDRDVDHVQAMRSRGLTIRGFDETFTVPVEATTPDQLPDRLEHVLLAVKAPATEAAVQSFADRLAPDGYVVSLQNGLNELQISALVGRERTIGAFVNFSADYLEPGLIHFGGRGAFKLGELDGQISPRLLELAAGARRVGPGRYHRQHLGLPVGQASLRRDALCDRADQ